MRYFRSDLDELVVRRAEADGLAVLDGGAPVGVRMRGGEVVVRMVMRVRDDAVGIGRLRIDLIGAGGIERHGIERRETYPRSAPGHVVNASQSQLGDTSSASAMWNDGRPSTTALAYSAILQLSTSLAMPKSGGWRASGRR